jgi:hypothetical protein
LFTPRGSASKKTLLPAEQDRPDIARKRTRWKAHQGRIDASRLVFIDETWIKTNMAPLRGWGPSGQRLQGSAPFGHWKTMTFIAALRYDRISAPWVIDGPINGELFTLYVAQVLAHTLVKGEIVILDILAVTKASPPATPSVPPELICSSCRPIAPISIRSSRSSPNSNTCSELQNHATSRRPGGRSANSSISSPPRSAPTTSKTQDMFPYKNIML